MCQHHPYHRESTDSDIYLCGTAMHHVYVSCISLAFDLALGSKIHKRYERNGDPDSFKVPFNAGLVGATMRVIEDG